MADVVWPVVFAHNDMLAGNIMLHVESGAVQLIDFEYGGCNYRGFDIANHWNEWAGGTQEEMNGQTEYERFPTDEQQLEFCQKYLQRSCGSVEQAAAEAPALVQEARTFVLVNHWYWGLWALNRAVEEGTGDFDYLTYARCRIGQYYAVRDAFTGGSSAQ